ncbi:MAG: hypothetical protein KF811_16185 [Dokdonella sp.]|nr:hypothetical protein [Dokdonella sp.]
MQISPTELIASATGVADPERLAEIERCLRVEVLMSTLDSVDPEVLSRCARGALALIEARAHARFVCMEFCGQGDPFFGGSADDRTLLTDGRFGHRSGRNPPARFVDAKTALEAGRKAVNRRGSALLSAIEMP